MTKFLFKTKQKKGGEEKTFTPLGVTEASVSLRYVTG